MAAGDTVFMLTFRNELGGQGDEDEFMGIFESEEGATAFARSHEGEGYDQEELGELPIVITADDKIVSGDEGENGVWWEIERIVVQ